MVDKVLKMASERLKLDIKDLVQELAGEGVVIDIEKPLNSEQKQGLVGFLAKRMSGNKTAGVRVSTVSQGKTKVSVRKKQPIVSKKAVKATRKQAEPEAPVKPSVTKIEPQADKSQQTKLEPVQESPVPEHEAPVEEEVLQSKTEAGITFAQPKKLKVSPIKAKIRASAEEIEKSKKQAEKASQKRVATKAPQSKAKVGRKADSKDSKDSKTETADRLQRKKGSTHRDTHLDRTMDKYKNFLGALDEEEREFVSSAATRKQKKSTLRADEHTFNKPTEPIAYKVEIGDGILVSDLAQKMSAKTAEVVSALFKMGVAATANETLDQDTAVLVVEELGHIPVLTKSKEETLEDAVTVLHIEGEEGPRAPVITVMGHVDHGKTTLLDTIRKSSVADGEAGGITQHLSAYHVEVPDGTITFVDTPGHAAFTSMRARGSQFTDIVVLIVAADDGVMPQTQEIIQHVKAAGVPMVVAVNKIDKPEANPDKVLQELSQHGIVSEAWGGEIPFVNISAKTGKGVDELLETLLLQAEILELTARIEGRATGTILECSLDRGRGIVANVLVNSGILKVGDAVLIGQVTGRIRALFDEYGKQVKQVGPSMPVKIIGLSDMPEAGDELVVVEDDRQAREVAALRQNKDRQKQLRQQKQIHLDNLFASEEGNDTQIVNIILKADAHGSLEAIQEALGKLGTDLIRVNIVGYGVGGVREADVTLAVAHNALIIGFNVRADSVSRKLIEKHNVDVRYYSIIYEAIDQVKQALEGRLESEFKEEVIGIAQVRDVFRAPKIGQIAGCMVTEGMVKRNSPIRVLRDEVVIYEGYLESLRRFKEDVAEVRNGTECGIGVKNYNDVKVGDLIEVFERIEIRRTL